MDCSSGFSCGQPPLAADAAWVAVTKTANNVQTFQRFGFHGTSELGNPPPRGGRMQNHSPPKACWTWAPYYPYGTVLEASAKQNDLNRFNFDVPDARLDFLAQAYSVYIVIALNITHLGAFCGWDVPRLEIWEVDRKSRGPTGALLGTLTTRTFYKVVGSVLPYILSVGLGQSSITLILFVKLFAQQPSLFHHPDSPGERESGVVMEGVIGRNEPFVVRAG
ncbi:hypothetical protein BC826DRAFT_1122469 [Russula brevipes]|nr:hypothetical protein BC826DRAFT_1122469 [Russula brevipes]